MKNKIAQCIVREEDSGGYDTLRRVNENIQERGLEKIRLNSNEFSLHTKYEYVDNEQLWLKFVTCS